MSQDAIWQAFAETGDPMYYLLYRSTKERQRQQKERNDDGAQGRTPRAED